MIEVFDAVPDEYRGLVEGQWYEVIVFSGARFEFWSPTVLRRTLARTVALDFVNGGELDVYGPEDIEHVRKIRAPKRAT